MSNKKKLLFIFNLILLAALVVSSHGVVLASPPLQSTPPLFSELSWTELGVVQKDLYLQNQSLMLTGYAFTAAASFPDKNPESIFEFYSSENLASLGWIFVGGVDTELAYKNEEGEYLTVNIEQCSSNWVDYCINVWLGEVTGRGPVSETAGALPFVKTTPANGSTIDPPLTTYQLLKWTDAQISADDRYEYCIDQTNNNTCDNDNWMARVSLYSGPDFSIVSGKTYYWQVRTQIDKVYANSGNWWSFTVGPYNYEKKTPANGAVIRPPSTTYRLLTWSDQGADWYQYCVDEINNNKCDTNWTSRNSLYSGGAGDFTVSKDHTYYWQVQILGASNSGANNGAWWSFTVQDFPLVYSIARYEPLSSTTNSDTVKYLVTFNQDVSGVDISDFSLTTQGLFDPVIVSVQKFDSNGIYLVEVSTGSGNGTLRLNLIDDDTIKNSKSNLLGGPGAGNGNFKTGDFYTIKKPVTYKSNAAEDGWILESDETSGVGGTLKNNSASLFIGDNGSDRQYRAILSFDTSLIPDTAVISAVTLKFKYSGKTGTLPFSTHGNLRVDVRKGEFSANPVLELADFKASSSKGNVLSFTNSSVNGWYSQPFTATNYQYINLTGITQFRLRFVFDDNDDGAADLLKIYSGDSSARPQLIIEYYKP